MSSITIFEEIECLTHKSKVLSGLELQKKWFRGADKRIIAQYLHKFINYNSENFNFLNVTPVVQGSDVNAHIFFQSKDFIGTVPLRAPDTGKQIGDFVVSPRFIGKNRFEDYINLLNTLQSDIEIESANTIPLLSGSHFKPPFYHEAIIFLRVLEKVVKSKWRKFENKEIVTNQPSGNINWSKYASKDHDPIQKLNFPKNTNSLSEFHDEYSAIRYVFDICKTELQSSKTPTKLRLLTKASIDFLERKLYYHKPLSISIIPIHRNDPVIVRECKAQANKILSSTFSISTGWRVNFSTVFERYVQFVFKKIATEIGGKLIANSRIKSNSVKYYSWEPKHLEPDAIYRMNDLTIMIDAKYKSHLYNKWSQSESLTDDYRHDLHQILAYSSFNNSDFKVGFLCYPSDKVEVKSTTYYNRSNHTNSQVTLVGLPLQVSKLNEAKNAIIPIIEKLQSR